MNTNDLIKAFSSVREIEADDVFGRIGLERRRGTAERVLMTLGIFGMGLAVGAGAALLLSPFTPEEARKKLAEGANAVKDQLTEGAEKLVEEKDHALSAVGNAVNSATTNLSNAAHSAATNLGNAAHSTATNVSNAANTAANTVSNKAQDANRGIKNGIATNERSRDV